MFLQDQPFGIPVLQVQDVLAAVKVAHVPLAPPEVEGALNLRGRIVTAINVRKRLGLDVYEGKVGPVSIVVEYNAELYSLVVDRVGDVCSIHIGDIENTPSTLDSLWRDIAKGIYRMNDRLMVMVDVSKLLNIAG